MPFIKNVVKSWLVLSYGIPMLFIQNVLRLPKKWLNKKWDYSIPLEKQVFTEKFMKNHLDKHLINVLIRDIRLFNSWISLFEEQAIKRK